MNQTEEIMGHVVFGAPVNDRTYQDVVDACKAADIPTKLAKELRPRFAFIRAMRDLGKRGVLKADFRDKTRDDHEAITFAFVVRNGMEDKISYQAEALVKFHKASGLVEILEVPDGMSREEVEEQAAKLITRAKTAWGPSDVNRLVTKYVAQYTRKIPLRAGVCFLPHQSETVVKKLATFYETLQVQHWILPVGHTPKNAENLHGAIVAEMKNQVKELVDEIKELKDKGKLTKTVGRNRLKELQTSLLHYRQLAEATRTDMARLIDAAGENAEVLSQAAQPLQSLLAMARTGGTVNPIVAELIAADEDQPDGQELARMVLASRSEEIALPDIDEEENTDEENGAE